MDLIKSLLQIASPGDNLSDLGGPHRERGAPQPVAEPDFTDTAMEATPRKMAYSHSMRDLIDAKYTAEPGYEDAIPFYPSDRHIQKNFAPEQTLNETELQRLANARHRALEYGVLTPELANYMLPIAMVEGRPESYGVSHDNRFYASPTNRRIFAQMGLRASGNDAPLELVKDARGDRFFQLTEAAKDYKPELMAAILAIKAQGAPTPETAIERWNGAGAQARNHRAKVVRARELLQHPKNAGLLEAWQNVGGEQD